MTVEEIVHGESKNVEFKVTLPKDSEKYTQTVVALGARIYWDELTCVGYEVTEDAVEKLCCDIIKFRNEMGLPKRDVTITQLMNWKLLKRENDSLLASNAFVLMTSDYFPFSKTQCAVFKGTDRTVFLDKREYSGPIYEQIVEATDFAAKHPPWFHD